MMPTSRWIASLTAVALLLLGGAALATDITEITPEDFYGAAYFKNALEHPKVAAAANERRQIAMVARDMGWNRRKLAAAIEKVRSLPGEPTELAKKAFLDAVAESRVEGRVLDVLFNDSEPKHVVMYVRWRGSKAKEAIKEASTIAHLVGIHAPFVSTLSLAAIHPKAPDASKKSVWQAKISRTSMERINPSRIETYAERMYTRMFEELKALPF